MNLCFVCFSVLGSVVLAILAFDRRSRQPLMSPSSELRGTRRVYVVRCAAKIGAANCADHRPGIVRTAPISARKHCGL
jgi:hypothetical protein